MTDPGLPHGSGDTAAVATAFDALTIQGGATIPEIDIDIETATEAETGTDTDAGVGSASVRDGTAAADREFDALAFSVFDKGCPSRSIFEHVTGRWGALVLGGLYEGPMRFNALRRRVAGVSEKMLAQALHALERDGFVNREVRSAIPPRVEYDLTALGREAAAALLTLVRLVEDRAADVVTAQRRYDATHPAD